MVTISCKNKRGGEVFCSASPVLLAGCILPVYCAAVFCYPLLIYQKKKKISCKKGKDLAIQISKYLENSITYCMIVGILNCRIYLYVSPLPLPVVGSFLWGLLTSFLKDARN